MNTLDFKKYKNKVDGIMIGREAYKNPWIFAKNPITSQQKIALGIKYIRKLKNLFTGKSIKKNSITHIQNIFNSTDGAKNWRKAVNFSIHNNDLQYLLNYIKSS